MVSRDVGDGVMVSEAFEHMNMVHKAPQYLASSMFSTLNSLMEKSELHT